MTTAAVQFGTIDATVLLQGVVSTVLYFLVGIVVLVAGFGMVDALTPGKLRREVFVDRRPNAVVITAAMDVSLALVIVAVIRASADQLGQGLLDTLVYGLVGVALQGIALAILEAVVPGRFRGFIDAEEFHPASIAAAVVLIVVGGINAVALS
ncbi:MAG TPA: DUF350 domain-containing protein [Mycobacterium sp.]|jgi:uncharacterized membrane protein YjfL (UPF0719 family)|nr:DUF350 domain-containing protein [Mycobacterium sp.]HEX4587625.1 DUF350 domain-containing protein [Mycobacterium sp.]